MYFCSLVVLFCALSGRLCSDSSDCVYMLKKKDYNLYVYGSGTLHVAACTLYRQILSINVQYCVHV